MSISTSDPRAIIERWVDAINAGDFAALESLLSVDCVSEYPQSGEIVRGRKNIRAILENYPGGTGTVDRTSAQVTGGDQWAMTPSFALVRLTGSGDARTAIFKSRYPDDSVWWLVHFIEFAAGKMTKQTIYFAPEFKAPEWRAQWVERHR
jgi:ketosteroid isomerase-like protein